MRAQHEGGQVCGTGAGRGHRVASGGPVPLDLAIAKPKHGFWGSRLAFCLDNAAMIKLHFVSLLCSC